MPQAVKPKRVEAEQFDLPFEPSRAVELMVAMSPQLEEDILMALRFNYYVCHRSVVPDACYDEAEREFINRPETTDESPLMQPGSDNKEDYPNHIQALAIYLGVVSLGKK